VHGGVCWKPSDAILDEFIVMPNHVHMIIMIHYSHDIGGDRNMGITNVRVQNFEPIRIKPVQTKYHINQYQHIIPHSDWVGITLANNHTVTRF
jgi:REP element-mobilizing transposase RayT